MASFFPLRKSLDQFRQQLTGNGRRKARPRPSSRPQLELLEDRLVPASPTLVTTASPSGTLALSTTPPILNDSAVLASGASPTGTITFKLFAPGVSTTTGTASYTDVVTIGTNSGNVTGNGTYNTSAMGASSGGFTLPTTGKVTGAYTWTAAYSGDGSNTTASDPGTSAAEHINVTTASPTVVGTASPNGTLPLTATAPTLNDSAVLASGYFETGTVTFKLFAPGVGTTGTASYIDVITIGGNSGSVTGNGTYNTSSMGSSPGGFTLPATGVVAGTWTWTTSYGSDLNNGSATDPGTSAAEKVNVLAAIPTLMTTASPNGTQSVPATSTTLNDSAVLASSYFGSGTITFNLYAPGVNTTTGTASYTDAVTIGTNSGGVSGNGTYSTSSMGSNSGGFTVSNGGTILGTWTWTANYSGDSNNSSASDPGTSAAEQVIFANTKPTVVVNNSSVTSTENVVATNTGSFFDPTDPTTIAVLSGGGSVTQTGTQSGTWTWTATGQPSTQTVIIKATDAHGATATTTFSWTVTDAPLTSSPSDLTPPVATQGVPFTNAVVFAFTDADTAPAVTNYTAVITLGDGNTLTVNSAGNVGTAPAGASGKIVANGSRFNVLLSYSYNSALSNVTFAVKAIDNSNGRTITDPTNSFTSQSVSNFSIIGPETWTGSVSTNWSVAGNWSGNVVPTSNFSITIPSGPANQPVLTAASAAFSVTINSGASFNANGNIMTIGGLTTVNGTYNGSTSAQTFGGGLAITGGTISGSSLLLGGNVTTSASGVFSSISGNLNLGGTRTFTVALGTAGIDLSISAVVSNGSITKLGTGNLTLAGANTYTGSTSIQGGTLGISADNNLGAAPAVATPADLVINGGTLLVSLLGAPNPGSVTLNSNRGIALGPTTGSGSGTIDVTDGSLTYGGVIANNGGTGGLIKTDLGQLTLASANTYTGATALQGGLVVVQANGGLGGAGAAGVTVSAGAELNLSSGTAYTTVEPLTINGNGVSNTGQGVFVGNNISWAGPVTLGSNSFVRSTNNTITFNGAINLGGFQLQINNAALTNNNRTVLSSTCTVTGGGSMLVSAGTLQVDGTATGIPVTVNSGATLSGKGTAGALTVNAGGTVSPGDPTLAGIGTLTASGANFLGGSTLLARVTGNTGTGVTNDKLAATGNLNLFNNTLSLDLTGLSKAGTLTTQSYTVASAATISGTFATPLTLLANPVGHALPIATYPSNTVLVTFTDVGSQWLDGPASSAPAVVPNIGQAGTQTQVKNAAPVIVAVLDTGIDAAGQAGVLPGWNFVANNSNTTDDNGHGTYIASLVTSVDPNAEILPLKFLDANGQGTTAGAIAAVDYAIGHGAKIVVAAWDVTDQSSAWATEVQKAESAGVLLVMAAGNNDQSLLSPLAAVHGNNVVVVGASDGAGQLASFSNADPSVVDLAAPGVNVLGAQIGGGEAAHSGTSVSTALVAGTAALEWSQRPDQSYQQVVAALLKGADQEPSLAGGVAGGRELNVLGALEADALPATSQVGTLSGGLQPTVTVVGMPATELRASADSFADATAPMPALFGPQQVLAFNEMGITAIPASEMAMSGSNLSSTSMEALPIVGSKQTTAFAHDTALQWLTSFDRGTDAMAGTQTMSNVQDAWSDSQDWLNPDSDELAIALAAR